MSEEHVKELLAQALGREISGVAEVRLARILFGVVLSVGLPAEDALAEACTLYARLLEEGVIDPAPPALVDVARLALRPFRP